MLKFVKGILSIQMNKVDYSLGFMNSTAQPLLNGSLTQKKNHGMNIA